MAPAARIPSLHRRPAPTTDHVAGMDDPRLRSRLLLSLLHSRLPDPASSLPSPPLSSLSSLPAYLKSHSLLSEDLPDPNLAAAVDAWVDRLLSLIASDAPDKSGVAIYLLGVTCEECSSHRFLASFSLWFEKLLSNIQLPSSTDFVRVASCASSADLFTRLARFSNLKKDAISLARKLVQPALHLLSESATEAVMEGAIRLLCTLMSFFPASMHSRFEEAEAVFVSKIMAAKFDSNMSKKFARCLALLANVRGNEDSWCLMMQRILIEVNNMLNDAFQGIEEEAKSSGIIRLLVPLGKEPPPPLYGQSVSGKTSEQTTKKLHELLLPRVSALLHCCCTMLSNPYPDHVTVPVRPLLALVWRVLKVDGSLPESLLLFTTSMQQELLCSELPSLHLDSLELLIAIIRRDTSLLLPHTASIIQRLTEYFRRSSMPSIRIKLYSIMQTLLISMRVGMPLYLVQELIENAYADLKDSPASDSTSYTTYSAKSINETLIKSNHRKRKHAFEPKELSNGVRLEIDKDIGRPTTPISVKIAALRALKALLSVGGSLQPERWRSNVDLLLVKVARNACDLGWIEEGNLASIGEETTPKRTEFQVAALEALLASLLSPSHVRPPYLSHGIELFTEGKQHGGTQLAGFCALALLALQALVRPQSLPVDDYSGTRISAFDEGFGHKVSEATFYGDRTFDAPSYSGGGLGVDDDMDDKVHTNWLKGNQETPVDAANHNEQTTSSVLPEYVSVDTTTGNVSPEENQLPSLDVRDEDVTKLKGDPNSSAREHSVSLAEAIDPAGANMHEGASKRVDAGVSCTNDTAQITENIVISSDASNFGKDTQVASTSLAAEAPSESLAAGDAMQSLVSGMNLSPGSDADPTLVNDVDPDSADEVSDIDMEMMQFDADVDG